MDLLTAYSAAQGSRFLLGMQQHEVICPACLDGDHGQEICRDTFACDCACHATETDCTDLVPRCPDCGGRLRGFARWSGVEPCGCPDPEDLPPEAYDPQ